MNDTVETLVGDAGETATKEIGTIYTEGERIAANIAMLLEHLEKKAPWLAKASGLSHQTIRRAMKGEQHTRQTTRDAIEYALGFWSPEENVRILEWPNEEVRKYLKSIGGTQRELAQRRYNRRFSPWWARLWRWIRGAK